MGDETAAILRGVIGALVTLFAAETIYRLALRSHLRRVIGIPSA